MRVWISAIVASALLSSLAHAQGPGFRFGGRTGGAWCLFENPYTYNCGSATAQQCGAAANGVGGICQPNPSGPTAAARTGSPPQQGIPIVRQAAFFG